MANRKLDKKIKTKKHLAREQREAKQSRLILIVAIVLGTIIFGLVAYGVIDQTIIRPRTPIAQVGDTIIRTREFESYVKYTRMQLLNQAYQYYTFYQQFGEFGASFIQTAQSIVTQLSQPVTFGSEILDEMIDNQIVRDEAAKRGIVATHDEVNEALQAAFGFFPDGTPTPTVTATIQPTPTFSETQLALITLTNTPTATEEVAPEGEEDATTLEDEGDEIPEAVEAEVVAVEPVDPPKDTSQGDADPDLSPVEATPTVTVTPTPYTTALFNQNIKEFNDVYSPYRFNIENLRELFEVQILREKLLEEVTKDMVPLKDEVWARHILVETYDEALEVLSLLEAGEDFHTLAETYSIDESNRDQGGNLGWFDANTMVPAFTEVAFSLGKGEISEPVVTEYGYHIIQSLGTRESQIPAAEFSQQKQAAFSEWLVEQRNSRDDIEIFEGWEKFVPTTPEVPQQFLTELYQQPQQ